MKNIKWNEYTWYSRLLALILFIIILPALTFYIGIRYEQTVELLGAVGSGVVIIHVTDPTAPISTSTPAVTAITNADMGKTITFKVGQSFALELGDLVWTVNFSSPAIVSKENVIAPAGSQGVYEAKTIGTTELTATGAPHCVAGEACPDFLELFKVTITVTK